MCRFFQDHTMARGATKLIGATTILAPLVAALLAFKSGDNDTGYLCLGWLASSAGALSTGYFLGRDDAPYVRIGARAEPHSLAIENAQLHNMPAFRPH